jgi:hypothetical protein
MDRTSEPRRIQSTGSNADSAHEVEDREAKLGDGVGVTCARKIATDGGHPQASNDTRAA